MLGARNKQTITKNNFLSHFQHSFRWTNSEISRDRLTGENVHSLSWMYMPAVSYDIRPKTHWAIKVYMT